MNRYILCAAISREETPTNIVKEELPIDSMRGKVSHVRQCIADQEKKSKEKPTILPNRKHRSSSLDERDGNSFLLRSNESHTDIYWLQWTKNKSNYIHGRPHS